MNLAIYLAGPVEQTDSPRGWRDRLKEQYRGVRDVEFIDPMDWQEDWHDDPRGCVERELEVVEEHPVLAYNIGRDAPRTVGTHHEIAHALSHGNQEIAVVQNGELPGFIRHRDVEVFGDPDRFTALLDAVHWLTSQRVSSSPTEVASDD